MEHDHVRENSTSSANQAIDYQIISELQYFSTTDSNEINSRINKIEKEYNIERILELNASILAFIGVLLGAFLNIFWLFLPGIVLPFLAFHAIQGWCPPIPILRALKVRTQKEIDTEKYSLKILRGDFDNLQSEKDVHKILELVRK